MQTIFPTTPGFAGFFLTGMRKFPDNSIKLAGAVVVKRTYTINPDQTASLTDPVTGSLAPATGPLAPAATALEVFQEDQPAKLPQNGDFKQGVANWSASSSAVHIAADASDPKNPAIQVTVTGAVVGAVTQAVSFPKGIGGRAFVFTFNAKADAPTQVSTRLVAGGIALCAKTWSLTSAWQTCAFPSPAQWPDVQALQNGVFTVELGTASDPARTVWYSAVVVASTLYENDMAPFKPQGDLILVVSNGSGPLNLYVNGALRLQAAAGVRWSGWQPRSEDPRKANAGTFPANPPPVTLPADFNNLYFNGYQRAALAPTVSALPYFSPGDALIIERSGSYYRFKLGHETLSASYETYRGSGPDRDTRWLRQSVPMNCDTLVIDPEANRCYAVWRGSWDFNAHEQGSYRRLTVTVSE